MARYTRFDELPVWQTATRLYNAVLDLVERPGFPLSSSFRSQLERAALSVSNNIAEGFERVTTAELLSFIAIARGSAGEVRSMILVVSGRPRLRPFNSDCEQILSLALSCLRQLTAWTSSIEESDITGKRHLTGREGKLKDQQTRAANFRTHFLSGLKPDHPLYESPDACAARNQTPN